jgi:hypothetical protein
VNRPPEAGTDISEVWLARLSSMAFRINACAELLAVGIDPQEYINWKFLRPSA